MKQYRERERKTTQDIKQEQRSKEEGMDEQTAPREPVITTSVFEAISNLSHIQCRHFSSNGAALRRLRGVVSRDHIR
jgi:hypothetical protein